MTEKPTPDFVGELLLPPGLCLMDKQENRRQHHDDPEAGVHQEAQTKVAQTKQLKAPCSFCMKVIFTSGHQPGGTVILEEKHKGLFINDLVGNCFADCDFQLILNPPRSDVRAALEFLKSIRQWDVKRLFLGHFGISDTPKKLIDGAIAGMQELLDIGARCYAEGGPDRMIQLVYEMKMKEVEKLRSRGQELYEYLRDELCLSQSRLFTEEFCRSMEQER